LEGLSTRRYRHCRGRCRTSTRPSGLNDKPPRPRARHRRRHSRGRTRSSPVSSQHLVNGVSGKVDRQGANCADQGPLVRKPHIPSPWPLIIAMTLVAAVGKVTFSGEAGRTKDVRGLADTASPRVSVVIAEPHRTQTPSETCRPNRYRHLSRTGSSRI
jgi:hypothetical protein